MIVLQTPSNAWQISASVTNGHHNWIEIRTYHGTSRSRAVAGFHSMVLSMGWVVL